MSLLVLQMCRFSSKQPSPQLRNSVKNRQWCSNCCTTPILRISPIELCGITNSVSRDLGNDLASGFLERKNKGFLRWFIREEL